MMVIDQSENARIFSFLRFAVLAGFRACLKNALAQH
jgi:methylphosphotriester-DNA--protein-cysteine methyltransferase